MRDMQLVSQFSNLPTGTLEALSDTVRVAVLDDGRQR
jgi:hypothetical protein